ncbi:hypothetical protein [Erythrobacter aureus]|nr:hypothetical protein [Erythrobacter aureus]
MFLAAIVLGWSLCDCRMVVILFLFLALSSASLPIILGKEKAPPE